MTVEIEAHKELVARLVKPGEQIVKELTPDDCNLLHMAVGVSGGGWGVAGRC